MEKIENHLNETKPIRELSFEPNENEILKQIQLVTAKPFFFIANLHEDEDKNTHFSALEDYAAKSKLPVIKVFAKAEGELVGLEPNEKIEYLEMLGLQEPALNAVIRKAVSYTHLTLPTTCAV